MNETKGGSVVSKIVARMEKMKSGNLQGIQRHNQRETTNHSNKDIDVSRSYLNEDLVHSELINYQRKVNEIIDSQRVSTRAVRKDAVLVAEWIITSDTLFFENKMDTKEFFKDALNYFEERCGSQNVAYATVHYDETTPHMHLGIVPMIDGALSSKKMFDRHTLKSIQDELPQYLQEKGHDIERGLKGSEQKHLTVEEFKENKQEIKRMERQINDMKQEVNHLSQQKNELTHDVYDLWHDDWLKTQEECPEFSMTYTVSIPEQTPLEVMVDQDTPRTFNMALSDVFHLFKEKVIQLTAYLAKKIENIAFKEVRTEERVNLLKEKENGLNDKLGALNNDIQIKQKESQNLDLLVQEKMNYIKVLERQSKLAVAMPDYVKPSKLNKDKVIVPKEKWLEKHVSANVIHQAYRYEAHFKHLSQQISQNVVADTNAFHDRIKNQKIMAENQQLKTDRVQFWNGFAKLLNKNMISRELIKELDLPNDFKQEFRLIDKKVEKNKMRDWGPSL